MQMRKGLIACKDSSSLDCVKVWLSANSICPNVARDGSNSLEYRKLFIRNVGNSYGHTTVWSCVNTRISLELRGVIERNCSNSLACWKFDRARTFEVHPICANWFVGARKFESIYGQNLSFAFSQVWSNYRPHRRRFESIVHEWVFSQMQCFTC